MIIGGVDLRFGDWRNELHDDWTGEMIACDSIITDPPFGKRTHASKARRSDGVDEEGLAPDYPPWTRDDVFEFVRAWSGPCKGWIVTMTSHDLVPDWEDAYRDVGRLCFAPVPCVMTGMSCRMRGDGPSSWSVSLMVARPRSKAFASWGTLPGAYVGARSKKAKSGRGKPPWLLKAIVGDYTRPGDLVVDPMCGWGVTAIEATKLGRRAIAADGHRDTFTLAQLNIQAELLK